MSSTAFPGWYVTFQAAVLQQLPRPEAGITKEEAEALSGNQAELKLRLAPLGTGNLAEHGKSALSTPRYRIDNEGIIYFSITSDGTKGSEWPERLQKHTGRPVGDYAKSVLLSPDFKPTSGITTEVAVLPGRMWKSDKERTTKNIHVEARRRKMPKLNAEAACLIRMMFTDAELEAMGLLWIVTMHEAIKDSDGYPRVLGSNRLENGPCLSAYDAHPGSRWNLEDGFAFEASQV